MTMSLGAGAIVAPLDIADATLLHAPMLTMLSLMAVVILLSIRRGSLSDATRSCSSRDTPCS